MRGGCKPFAAGQEMVGIAGLGPADRQTVEHAVRDRRGRAQACRYPAQDVGQRNRLPRRLRRQGHATIVIELASRIPCDNDGSRANNQCHHQQGLKNLKLHAMVLTAPGAPLRFEPREDPAPDRVSACGVYRTDLHVVAIARLLCTGLIGWRSLVMGGWKGSRHLWLWRGRAYHRAGGPLAGPSGQSGGRGSYVLVQPRVEDSLSSPIWNAISDERPSAPETAPPGLYIGACP